MKLPHNLIGLLMLIGLMVMTLLLIQGTGQTARARASPAEIGFHSAINAPPLITTITSHPEVIASSSTAPQTDSLTSTTDLQAQALTFDIELTTTSTEVESWTEMEYMIRYTVNNQPASNVIITSSIPFIAQDCDGNDIFAQ